MSHDELSQIISRLDRLETKVDNLSSRFAAHEGCAVAREDIAAEFRRMVTGVVGGVGVAIVLALGGFIITVYNHIGGK